VNYSSLFDGPDEKDRFYKLLAALLHHLPEAKTAALGKVDDIGTHSIRKGAATWAAALVDGPSSISIYLRAGWSLGVQDRYIFEGEGQSGMYVD
jgi:hypothetical protein